MPDLMTVEWFTFVAIGVISVARMARLLVFDDFPPAKWLRVQYVARVPEAWSGLAECPFCLAPYLMAGQIGWFLALAGNEHALYWGWLLPNLWWALSYLAAILVAYDEGVAD